MPNTFDNMFNYLRPHTLRVMRDNLRDHNYHPAVREMIAALTEMLVDLDGDE